LLGTWVADDCLLREGADLDVDSARVPLPQREHRVHRRQPADCVHVGERAHRGRPVAETVVDCSARTLDDLRDRVLALQVPRALDRLLEHLRSRLNELGAGVALVQMDVAVDEALRDESAAGIRLLAVGRELRGDRGDPAAVDAELPEAVPAAETGVANHMLHALTRWAWSV